MSKVVNLDVCSMEAIQIKAKTVALNAILLLHVDHSALFSLIVKIKI